MPPPAVHNISSTPRYEALSRLQQAKCQGFLEQNPGLTPEAYEVFSYNCAFQEFRTAFGPESDYSSGDYNTHHESTKSLLNGYNESPIRSIYWRLFLQIFGTTYSPILWTDIIEKQRQSYNELTNRYALPYDPRTGKLDLSLLASNPHTAITQDNFTEYVALCDTIKLDLIRTYPSCGYYTHQETQDQLLNILYLWCCEHQEAYKQGMNELAALLLYTFSYDSSPTQSRQSQLARKLNTHSSVNSSNPTSLQEKLESLEYTFATLVNCDFIAHDVYQAFSAVMLNMGQYYSVTAATRAQSRTLTDSGAASPIATQQVSLSSRSGATGNTPASNEKNASGKNGEPVAAKEPPIVLIASHIFHTLLPVYDPDLYRHLTEIDVIPTLFLLRWVRLLFTREFASLDESSILHDSLFATSQNDFSLLPYIAIAMIHLKRDDLLQADDTSSAFEYLLRSVQNEWWSDDEQDEDSEQNDNSGQQQVQSQTPDDDDDDPEIRDETSIPRSAEPSPLATPRADLFVHEGAPKPDNFDLFGGPDDNSDQQTPASKNRDSVLDLDDISTDLLTRPRATIHALDSSPASPPAVPETQPTTPLPQREKREKREKPLSICKRAELSVFPSQIIQLAHTISKRVAQLPKTGKPFTAGQLQQISLQTSTHHLKVPPPPAPPASKSSSSKVQYSGTDYDRSQFGASPGKGKKGSSSSSGKGLFGFVSKIGQALDSGGGHKSKGSSTTSSSSSTKSPAKSTENGLSKHNRSAATTATYEPQIEYSTAMTITEELLSTVNELLSGIDTNDFLEIQKSIRNQNEFTATKSNTTTESSSSTSEITSSAGTGLEKEEIDKVEIESPLTTGQTAIQEVVAPTSETITTPTTLTDQNRSPTALPDASQPITTTPQFHLTTSVSISQLVEMQQKLTQLQSTLEVLSQQTSVFTISAHDDYFKTSSSSLAQLGNSSIYAKNTYSAYGHETDHPTTPRGTPVMKFDTHGFVPKKKEITITDDVGFEGISVAIPSATALPASKKTSTTASTTSQFPTRERSTALSSETPTPTHNQHEDAKAHSSQPQQPSSPTPTNPTIETKPQSTQPSAKLAPVPPPPHKTQSTPVSSTSSKTTLSMQTNKIVDNAKLVNMALFDDDDDDDDNHHVPATAPTVSSVQLDTKSTPQPQEKVVQKTPKLAPVDTQPPLVEQPKKRTTKQFKPNQKGLLFGSDDDDDGDDDERDEDIFNAALPVSQTAPISVEPSTDPINTKPAQQTQQPPQSTKPDDLFVDLNDGKKTKKPAQRSLFDDDPEDIFSATQPIDTKKYSNLFE